jgi:hypothetical protein
MTCQPGQFLNGFPQARSGKLANKYSGCWHVLAWKGPEFRFVETKLRGRDKIRDTQISWFEAALETGWQPESFLIVEWSFA